MEATTGDSPPPTHRPPTPARPPCFDIFVFLSGLASLALPGTVGPTQSSIPAATAPPRSCRPASPEDKPGLPSQTWPRWRREVLVGSTGPPAASRSTRGQHISSPHPKRSSLRSRSPHRAGPGVPGPPSLTALRWGRGGRPSSQRLVRKTLVGVAWVTCPGGGGAVTWPERGSVHRHNYTFGVRGRPVPQKKRGDILSEQNNIHSRLAQEKLENKRKKSTLFSYTALAIFNTFPSTLSIFLCECI